MQAAVLACQLAVHCRNEREMGVLQRNDFEAIARRSMGQVPFVPEKGNIAAFLRTSYSAYLLQYQQRQAAMQQGAVSTTLPPVPEGWRCWEECLVKEVRSHFYLSLCLVWVY